MRVPAVFWGFIGVSDWFGGFLRWPGAGIFARLRVSFGRWPPWPRPNAKKPTTLSGGGL
jgi:hypothetical protein